MAENQPIKDLLLKGYADSIAAGGYSTVSNANDAFLIVDLQGTIRFVSPRGERLLGAPASEWAGTSLARLLPGGELLAADLAREEARPLKGSLALGENGAAELGAFMLPVVYDRELIGQLLLLTGETDADRAERRDRLERTLLSEKLSAAGQLAAGIAHEIRNPLTAIKGFLKLSRSYPERADRFFEVAFSEIDRIELIVNELLLLAKPNEVKMEPLCVRELLNQMIKLMEPQALLHAVEIRRDDRLSDPVIYGDENQIKQVIINLMKNAIEAMKDGGNLLVEAENRDGSVHIRMIDTGPGIPEASLRQIGEPFFSTKEGGTGLGLLLSKQIIENHAGRFVIRTGEEGTCMEMILPQIHIERSEQE